MLCHQARSDSCGGLTVQVMSYGASAESAAITTIFTRMLQHSLKDSHGLSQHPAATGVPQLLLLMLSGLIHLTSSNTFTDAYIHY